MALKTLLWGGFFAVTCLGALGAPMWGIVGYVTHYSIGPERQWWNVSFQPLGIRYSLTLAACTAIGVTLRWRHLRFGKSLLAGQEKLMLLLVGIAWLAMLLGEETGSRYAAVDHPTVKLAKMMIFVLMMTHVVTDLKKMDWLLWTLVVGELILGYQAYTTPYGAFDRGRLESVGGPDFHDANRFGGYMAGMLFIAGAQFMRTGKTGKIVCFLAGGFTANALILTNSRGATLGVVVGWIMALVSAPKKYRALILAGLVVAGLGFFSLTDQRFLRRMGTVVSSERRERPEESRIRIWRGGVRMLLANPLGVGPGNFHQNLPKYAPDHGVEGDAHNTFIRCGGELGFPGLAVFSLIVLNAFWMLRRIMAEAPELPPEEGRQVLWATYGALTGLTAMLTYGLTGTLLYTEYLWWMLGLPVCLARVVENIKADQALGTVPLDPLPQERLRSVA